jgi:hypothetical protein
LQIGKFTTDPDDINGFLGVIEIKFDAARKTDLATSSAAERVPG